MQEEEPRQKRAAWAHEHIYDDGNAPPSLLKGGFWRLIHRRQCRQPRRTTSRIPTLLTLFVPFSSRGPRRGLMAAWVLVQFREVRYFSTFVNSSVRPSVYFVPSCLFVFMDPSLLGPVDHGMGCR
jgi:hypothetical protein